MPQIRTIVTLTPTVPTPKGHFTAHAIQDFQEMESRVLVSLYIIHQRGVNLPYHKKIFHEIVIIRKATISRDLKNSKNVF